MQQSIHLRQAFTLTNVKGLYWRLPACCGTSKNIESCNAPSHSTIETCRPDLGAGWMESRLPKRWISICPNGTRGTHALELLIDLVWWFTYAQFLIEALSYSSHDGLNRDTWRHLSMAESANMIVSNIFLDTVRLDELIPLISMKNIE